MGRPKLNKEVGSENQSDESLDNGEVENNSTEQSEKTENNNKPFSVTLTASHPQFNGTVTRTFDNKNDADAWQKRFDAKEA